MRKFKRALQGVLLVVGVAMSGTAFSEKCSGTYHNVGDVADTHDLGNGVTLTAWSAFSSNYDNGTNEIRPGACTGYTLTMADGNFRVVYACARKTSDGSVAVDEGSLEPGAERGTWKITSATGSLAKTLGDSGWWQGTIQDGKVSAGIWGGNCTR
jgi:hypothetical protein